ncbi:hypothetical protein BTVI_38240 [Pitangus sulphuratus]|nr:hypothetical protein BTVI_38240 [Pitangus sulphuratus]
MAVGLELDETPESGPNPLFFLSYPCSNHCNCDYEMLMMETCQLRELRTPVDLSEISPKRPKKQNNSEKSSSLQELLWLNPFTCFGFLELLRDVSCSEEKHQDMFFVVTHPPQQSRVSQQFLTGSTGDITVAADWDEKGERI